MNEIVQRFLGSSIARNLVSLLTSQAVGYIFPLITIPYIVKTVGVANFGRVSFVLAIMGYISILIDYGYSYLAPKEIAFAQGDTAKLSISFSKINTFKGILFFVSSALIVVSAVVIQSDYTYLLLGGVFYLAGIVFSPRWFFQGVERMEFISIVDVLSKALFTVAIFIVVLDTSDYIYIPLVWGGGGVLSSIIGIVIVAKKFKVSYVLPSKNVLSAEMKTGFPVFISNISTYSTISSNVLFLGLFHGDLATGLYSIAEKVAKIPWALASVVSSVIYPQVCLKAKDGPSSAVIFLNKTMTLLLPATGLVVMVGLALDEFIISFFTNENQAEVEWIFDLLLISTFIVVINIPLNLMLFALNANKRVMKISLFVGGANLIASLFLTWNLVTTGAVLSHVFTLVLLAGLLYYWQRRTILELKKDKINA